MKAWTQTLVSEGTSKEEVDMSMDTDAPAVAVHRLGGDPKLKVIICLFSIFDCGYCGIYKLRSECTKICTGSGTYITECAGY